MILIAYHAMTLITSALIQKMQSVLPLAANAKVFATEVMMGDGIAVSQLLPMFQYPNAILLLVGRPGGDVPWLVAVAPAHVITHVRG